MCSEHFEKLFLPQKRRRSIAWIKEWLCPLLNAQGTQPQRRCIKSEVHRRSRLLVNAGSEPHVRAVGGRRDESRLQPIRSALRRGAGKRTCVRKFYPAPLRNLRSRELVRFHRQTSRLRRSLQSSGPCLLNNSLSYRIVIAPFSELPKKHEVEPLYSEISVPSGRQFEQTEDHLVIHAAELPACRVSTVLLDGELLDPRVIVLPILCEESDYVKGKWDDASGIERCK
jgi:hypothetical protein